MSYYYVELSKVRGGKGKEVRQASDEFLSCFVQFYSFLLVVKMYATIG
jgi:hypothetical protein